VLHCSTAHMLPEKSQKVDPPKRHSVLRAEVPLPPRTDCTEKIFLLV